MNNTIKHIKQWSGTLVFIVLLFAFRSAVADWYEVPTGSMKPAIIEGDRIFVNKLAYDIKIPFTLVSLAQWDKPMRGDVVVFDSPNNNSRLVKRVIGLPGDIISIHNNHLFINNTPAHYSSADQSKVTEYWKDSQFKPFLMQETFNSETPHTISLQPYRDFPGKNFGPIVIPNNHYFMLGDNRDNSADSRFIGPVHERLILGKANKVILSTQRLDRFFVELI